MTIPEPEPGVRRVKDMLRFSVTPDKQAALRIPVRKGNTTLNIYMTLDHSAMRDLQDTIATCLRMME